MAAEYAKNYTETEPMAIAELSDIGEDTPKEDIAEYAAQVAKEVEEERKGEEPEKKSDAQIASEHANTEQPGNITAETDSGSETAEVDTDQEETVEDGGEETGPEWFDDDLKAEIAAYQVDEKEFADFGSREEVERALRLFDKAALDAGRKAMAEGEGGQEAEEKTGRVRGDGGKFVPDPKTEAKEEEPESPEGKYEITLPNEEMWDEDVAAGVRKVASELHSRFESRVAALESQLMESESRSEEQQFDSLVDSLGHADLFGKTDKETKAQLKRREDLMVSVKAQQIGLQQLGRPADLDKSLVNRVARMVFAEELGKKDLKAKTRKITKQSNGRQGGGATRPQEPREDPRDAADRRWKALDGS